MAGAGAIAHALALFQQPGLRHDLRDQPLPGDVEQLLVLAGNEGPPLEQAAATLAIDPASLQQAARFYVLEVLLFAAADDYRLLGTSPGADAVTLKRHYRLLQSWLHPDRAEDGGGASVHAARINAAFHRLRRLPADDAGAAGDDCTDPGLEDSEVAVRVQHWVRVEDPAPGRGGPQRAIAALAAVSLLAGGLWLAWQGPRSVPPEAAGTWAVTAPALPAADEAPTPAPARFTEALQSPGIARDTGLARPPHPLPSAPAALAMPAPTLAPVPAPVPDPASAVATAGPGPRPGPVRVPAPAAAPPPAATAATAATAPVATATTAAIAPDPPTAAPAESDPVRADQAMRRAQALLGFLTGSGQVPPPIWRSGQALEVAQATRVELAGQRRTRQPQVLHDQARWRIGPEQAQLQVPVRTGTGQVTRTLHARFGWHDQDWWVESVALHAGPAMEPAQ